VAKPAPTAIGKRNARQAGVGHLLLIALLVSACAPELHESSGTTVPNQGTIPSSQAPVTTVGTSVLDDPVFEEFGGWWLVTTSRLVVRGTLVGTDGQFRTGDRTKDIWLLDVQEVLLGESDSNQLRVATFSVEDIELGLFEYQRQLQVGEEGIFFLVPYFGPDALPEVLALNLGSIGIITTDLDHWSEHLPKAADILGSLSLGYPRAPEPLTAALLTEFIVEGRVDSISAPSDVLGWPYAEAELTEVDVVWPERSNNSEGSFELPRELIFIVEAGHASDLVGSETVRVRLRKVGFPDPVGAQWLAFGRPDLLMDRDIARRALSDEMDDLVRQRDGHVTSARQSAVQALSLLVEQAGRIPLSSDPPPEAEPIDLDRLYRSPLVIRREATVVTFDRWFMTLLDGEATVTVTSIEGTILATGPVEGPGSIMRELADHSFEFVNDHGEVVARITQGELSAAQVAAYDQAANR
jgi:hypothetical protein